MPPGENNNGATLPVSQLEQGGAWRHWSSSKIYFPTLLVAKYGNRRALGETVLNNVAFLVCCLILTLDDQPQMTNNSFLSFLASKFTFVLFQMQIIPISDIITNYPDTEKWITWTNVADFDYRVKLCGLMLVTNESSALWQIQVWKQPIF